MLTRQEIEALAFALDHLHQAVAVPVAQMGPILSVRQKLGLMLASMDVKPPADGAAPTHEEPAA